MNRNNDGSTTKRRRKDPTPVAASLLVSTSINNNHTNDITTSSRSSSSSSSKKPTSNNHHRQQQRRMQKDRLEKIRSKVPEYSSPTTTTTFDSNNVLHPRTLQAVGILVLAIFLSIVWNKKVHHYSGNTIVSSFVHNNATLTNNRNQTVFVKFIETMCQRIVCHNLLIPNPFRRTHTVRSSNNIQQHPNNDNDTNKKQKSQLPSKNVSALKIRSGEVVLKIPKQYTVWDCDVVFYDPWIYTVLIEPMILNATTTAPATASSSTATDDYSDTVSPAAYLAVFLARQLEHYEKQQKRTLSENGTSSTSAASSSSSPSPPVLSPIPLDPLLIQYVTTILPKQHTDHPVMWTEMETKQYFFGNQTNGERIPATSSSYHHVRSIQNEIQKEYQIFVERSPNEFPSLLSYERYRTARLNVLTRSFGTGPVISTTKQSSLASSYKKQKNAFLKHYPNTASMFFAKQQQMLQTVGAYAMVPILDQYNHRANPNVEFFYTNSDQKNVDDGGEDAKEEKEEEDDGSFIVRAVRTIPSNEDVWDTYGKRTDSDLFARYGFVSMDGTDYTQASLALFHNEYIDYNIMSAVVDDGSSSSSSSAVSKTNGNKTINNRNNKPLQYQLARYLQYDDGYEHCIYPVVSVDNPTNHNDDDDDNPNHPDKNHKNGRTASATTTTPSWKLKQLKFQYLLHRAHLFKHWVAVFGPRRTNSLPNHSVLSQQQQQQQQPPTFPTDKTLVRMIDSTYLFSTCRVITLTEYDYNHTSYQLLEQNVYNLSYVLPTVLPQQGLRPSALEYRTMLCIARMVQSAIQKFPYKIGEDYHRLMEQMREKDSDSTNNNDDDVQNNPTGSHHTIGQQTKQQQQHERDRNRTITYLRVGELQSYMELKNIAFAYLRRHPFYVDQMNRATAKEEKNQPSHQQHPQEGVHNDQYHPVRYSVKDQPCSYSKYVQSIVI